jgi:hypothetical protein
MTHEYVAHPLAATFPMIEGSAFEELKADIRKHGILEPIRLWWFTCTTANERAAWLRLGR